MLKRRLIPVVLMRNGVVVQSKGFRRYQALGNPSMIVERLSAWASDELIYLDITRTGCYDLGRDDLDGVNRATLAEILRDVSRRCFMPLAFGGGIRTIADGAARLEAGADKIVLNTQPLCDPSFISKAAREFGAQCIVVCIDALQRGPGFWEAMAGGHSASGHDAVAWAREAAERGAGEILVQSVDFDGRGRGYDLPLIEAVAGAVGVPVIALGGAGKWSHFAEGLRAGADAVAAANLFNYTEHSVYRAKEYLGEQGFEVRAPALAEMSR